MLKYRAMARITADKNDTAPYLGLPLQPGIIGYKLTAGLYIAYVTPETCEAGIRAEIIEPIVEPLRKLTYREMRARVGIQFHERLSYALEQSTVSMLKRNLERINDGARTVEVEVYAAEWTGNENSRQQPLLTLMERIRADLERREILAYESFLTPEWLFPAPIFAHTKTYEDFLDCLARTQWAMYMNSGDLFKRFWACGFCDSDRFNQRRYKFKFHFSSQRIADKKETGKKLTQDEIDELTARHQMMWKGIRSFTEKKMAEPFTSIGTAEISAGHQTAADELQSELEGFLAKHQLPRLYGISDEASLAYAVLSRRYVAALREENPAVMRDICRNRRLFSRMGDAILLLAAGVLWTVHPANRDSTEERELIIKSISRSFISTYSFAGCTTWERKIPLFHHWLLTDMPDREAMIQERMCLLTQAERTALSLNCEKR